jgi:hypothetical protein
MKLYLVIEDWGDGVTAYPRSTRAKAEATRAVIEATHDNCEDCRAMVWIQERVLDAPCEEEEEGTIDATGEEAI